MCRLNKVNVIKNIIADCVKFRVGYTKTVLAIIIAKRIEIIDTLPLRIFLFHTVGYANVIGRRTNAPAICEVFITAIPSYIINILTEQEKQT